MANFEYDPIEGWENETEFPDYPTAPEVRPLFQRLFDQIRDAFNGHKAEKASDSVLGHIKIGAGLSIDAGGVAVATGFKVGTFTRDTSLASGTQAITGVGFKPRVVLFLASISGAVGEMSIGLDDLVTPTTLLDNYGGSANSYSNNPVSISLNQNNVATYKGVISSFDNDGFTLSWTKAGAKTGTMSVSYLAIR
jgi:hypothetical protein